MYHNKNFDYVYLLWEDLVYQVENKNSKKNNDMYYPRFTKVIVDYFMAKDQSIPRRNKIFWHTARDDPMFTTIRVISKHQDMQIYGAILPQHLTNQAMLESEAYKTYHAYATGEKIPKPKYVKNKADFESSPKKKSAQASKGKRIKTSTKVAKPVKKKQPTITSKEKGLNVLSEVALSEAEQIKLATKRSLIQTHNSHANCSGADKGTGKSSDEDDDDEVHVSEDDDEVHVSEDDDNQNDDDADNEDDDDQDDDNEQTGSDNDDDDLWSDDEAYDDETQGVNVEGEELDEEQTNEEEEANELYKDVNVNMEGRDTEMTDAPQTNIQSTQVTEDTHVIITFATPEGQHQSSSVSSGFISNMLDPNPDTGIDSILNLNIESTSLVNVPVSMNVEMPPLSFEDRVKALEHNFSEFQQTNQFVVAVSSIPSIVGTKIIKKQVKEQVKEQVSKILPKIEKFVNDQVKAEVLTCSSNQAKTSHVKTLETYGDTVTFKICQDDEDKDEEPSAGSNRGSKRRRAGKEPESTSAPKEKTSKLTDKSKEGSKSHHTSIGKSAQEEPIHADEDLEEAAHQEFDTGFTEIQ
ncbi:hypothetical protein Tco_0832856 [Tanacetum coccineum]